MHYMLRRLCGDVRAVGPEQLSLKTRQITMTLIFAGGSLMHIRFQLAAEDVTGDAF